MVRARVFGDRMAAIGQSLAARLRLALQEQDIPLWLDAPMTELITDTDGPDARVIGAVVERDGKAQRIQARHGVILASGASITTWSGGANIFPSSNGSATSRARGLELRQSRRHRRRYPGRREGRRIHRTPR